MNEKPLTAKEAEFLEYFEDVGNKVTYHNVKRSYMAAYPNSSEKAAESNGIRLIRKDKMDKAITAKRVERAEKADRTVQQLDAMYVEDRELARSLKQPSAAVSATTGIAKLYGLDKKAGGNSKDGLTLNFTTTPPKAKEAKPGGTIKLHKDTA